MQTLIVEVKDDFMQEFMKMIEGLKDNVVVRKDQNLKLDPYFYERQEKLQQILESDGEKISHEKLWDSVHKHLETIKSKS